MQPPHMLCRVLSQRVRRPARTLRTVTITCLAPAAIPPSRPWSATPASTSAVRTDCLPLLRLAVHAVAAPDVDLRRDQSMHCAGSHVLLCFPRHLPEKTRP